MLNVCDDLWFADSISHAGRPLLCTTATYSNKKLNAECLLCVCRWHKPLRRAGQIVIIIISDSIFFIVFIFQFFLPIHVQHAVWILYNSFLFIQTRLPVETIFVTFCYVIFYIYDNYENFFLHILEEVEISMVLLAVEVLPVAKGI